jgi:hypothetical protein
MAVTWSLAMVKGNNKINDAKKSGKLLAISITTGMQQSKAGRMAQWSTSRASLEATGCCHWASVCAVLPWRPSWLAILVENTKHYQKLLLAS